MSRLEYLRAEMKKTKTPEFLDLIEEHGEIKREDYKKMVSAALKHIDVVAETVKGGLMVTWAAQEIENMNVDFIKGQLLRPLPQMGPGPKRRYIRRITTLLEKILIWEPTPEVHPAYGGMPTTGGLRSWLDQWGYNIFETPKRKLAERALLEYEKRNKKPLYKTEVRKSDPVKYAPEPFKEGK
jgi:hypothetical protein